MSFLTNVSILQYFSKMSGSYMYIEHVHTYAHICTHAHSCIYFYVCRHLYTTFFSHTNTVTISSLSEFLQCSLLFTTYNFKVLYEFLLANFRQV
jgi:hypothetical protein